jgi:2-polyprenyl-3-methyl-5-hydroxy-6-metoxy-1,4-benzoquinol methylase
MDYREHYRIDAEEFDYWGKDQFSPAENRRNQFVFELGAIHSGMKVLDIGSGRGWFSLYAAEQGADVTAVDLSEKNLQKIREINSRVNTVYADALNLPLEEGSFDLIVALEVLEHITDPKNAVDNWKRLLKPNGRLLITVPYKETIRYTLCIHCNQKTPVNSHLHTFDRESLYKLLNHHGFWIKQSRLFTHKLLINLRIDRLTKWLPFRFWKFLDRLCRVFGDRYSFIAVIATLKQ